MVIALLLGAVSWTFLEYVIHRWMGHDKRFRPNLFAAEHIQHHSRGNYFSPAYMKVLSALVTALILSPIAWYMAGAELGLSFVVGLVCMYLVYEWVHYRDHVHPGYGPYARMIRRHHFYHHFVDPRFNHGVTSPFWDMVFRTYRKPGLIRVPEKLAMRWLVLDESGQLPPHLSSHYELVLQSSRK